MLTEAKPFCENGKSQMGFDLSMALPESWGSLIFTSFFAVFFSKASASLLITLIKPLNLTIKDTIMRRSSKGSATFTVSISGV